MEEFPEEKGYLAHPGWVKGNPKNNAIYLERCYDTYPEWKNYIKAIDRLLNRLAPGYNIDQIKDKFGGLRFYWTAPADLNPETALILRECVAHIEELAPELR